MVVTVFYPLATVFWIMLLPVASSIILPRLECTFPGGTGSTSPWIGPNWIFESQCNTGHLQCCNSIVASNDLTYQMCTLIQGIGAGSFVGDNSYVGFIGVGGTSCTSQLVCCQDNNWGGVFAFGCIPVKAF
ncbi:hypothetical protein BDQ12DRAFT_665941 [Crucibulum laeve]|uniref:Hydrophobin n=1 Tax=Crucibulum laeve TaxID=68775 RepID=A0A5C3LZZ5_9AGAR|nr:hypothetical protein BDQ12DRAFT_665941 [Crucibulum laeve]